MKKLLFVIILATLATCGLAQNKTETSTKASSESRELEAFHKINLTGAFRLYLKKGDKNEIKIDTRGNIRAAEVQTTVHNNKLKIHTERKNYQEADRIDLWITYRDSLTDINASGAGRIESENEIVCHTFTIDISGATTVELSFNTNRAEVNLSGAGTIRLGGKTDFLKAQMSGAGTIHAYRLEAQTADVSLEGVGSIRVNVKKELSARAEGIGNIRYLGEPEKLNLKAGLLSSIKPEN